jgi:hypothetical protein
MLDKHSAIRRAWAPILDVVGPALLFLAVQGCSPADKNSPATDATASETEIPTVTVDKP